MFTALLILASDTYQPHRLHLRMAIDGHGARRLSRRDRDRPQTPVPCAHPRIAKEHFS